MTVVDSRVLRTIYPRVLSRMFAVTRSLPDAEDAMQEAIVRALATWGERGTPDSPEAWLTTVATNVHRDRLRKGRWEQPRQDGLEVLAQASPWVQLAVGEREIARGWKDELLALLFACCHPALEDGEASALCLATIVGMSTTEIAAAFRCAPRTMEQRLTRARRRLRERGDCEGVRPEAARVRLPAVLRAIHLLFSEGYWSNDDTTPIRVALCRLAIGLARSLRDAYPDEPEVAGLCALLMLHDARRRGRHGPDGEPVALPQQDRSRWDHDAIAVATALLHEAARRGRPGPYQLEAAISATHCRGSTAAETDWVEIAALYEALEAMRPVPAVRVNRAFALARAEGPRAGLRLLTDVDEPYVHLVRGSLLAELGERDAAVASLRQAHAHARNAAERRDVQRKIEELTR